MAEKGFRNQKKMSQFQLTQGLAEMNQRLNMLVSAVANDMNRLNVLFFHLLKEQGKAEEITCKKCDMINMRPLIEGIEIDPRCAECGHLLDELPQEVFTDGEVMDSEEE